MRTKHRRVKVFFILLLIINTYQLFAQFEHPLYNFPSPEANQQCTYGKIPTVPFTGVANISIPIYELKLRNISVPVQLSYHTSNVKPNLHPGWVGLGWTLSAGGCITRTVNCLADEQEDDKGNRLGFFGHYSELDRDDWYSKSRVDHYIEINDGSYDLYDLMPDEFNFNFCGYSGSFYMDHKGQFAVHSSSDIKVEFNKRLDCISIFDTRDKISSKVKTINDGSRTNRTLINKITLVTPDGIRYEFGGINATEYSIPYFNQKDGYLYATSWFLTRIVSPEGDYVDFTYEPGDPIGEAKPVYSEVMKGDNSTMSASFNKNNRQSCDAQIIFPVYLKKITTEAGSSVSFTSRIRADLGITNSIFDQSPFYSGLSIFQDYNDPGTITGFINSGKDFKWRVLTEIKTTGEEGDITVNFDYRESNSLRPHLISIEKQIGKIVQILDKYSKEIHRFNYYSDVNSGLLLPNTYYTDRTDHWGYYTGIREEPDYNITPEQYSWTKSSNRIEDTRTELLKSITYPTGGRSEFIYDKHDYSKYVTDNNTYNIFSSGGMGYTLFNANGAPIGYSNVIEVAFDSKGKASGYKKYAYSNFDTDLWDESHLNDLPFYFTPSLPDYRLARYSERENERGLLQSEDFYSNDGKLRESVRYKYRKNDDAYIRALQYNELYLGSSSVDRSKKLKYMSAYKICITPCLLAEKTDIIYGYGQSNTATVKTTYSYDSHHILTKTSMDVSGGKQLVTTYTHPYHYTDDAVCKSMERKNILTPIIEKKITVKKNGQERFLYKEKYNYQLFNDIPYIYTIRTANREESNEEEEFRCEKTDSKGNPVSVFMKGKPESVILWKKHAKVPSIWIKGASYSEVTSITGDELDAKKVNVSNLYSRLPNAQINCFYYKPNGIKLSEVDPREIKLSYQYNDLDWLEAILRNNTIIKTYEYGSKVK